MGAFSPRPSEVPHLPGGPLGTLEAQPLSALGLSFLQMGVGKFNKAVVSLGRQRLRLPRIDS